MPSKKTIFSLAMILALLLSFVTFEPARAAGATIIVNEPSDLNILSSNHPDWSSKCTLRWALISANRNRAIAGTGCAAGINNQDVILISSSITEVSLTIDPDLVAKDWPGEWYGGDLDIAEGVTIRGNPNISNIDDRTTIQLSPNQVSWSERIFHIKTYDAADTVTLRDLKVQGGTGSDKGGGIYLQQGKLSLVDAEVSNNMANTSGGGIFVEAGATLDMNNVMMSNNVAGSGGGVRNLGTATIKNSYFGSNYAQQPVQNSGYGGGLLNNTQSGSATLVNVTFESNRAARGGAVYSDAPLTIQNSTFVRNIADDPTEGAEINVTSSGTISNSVILQKNTTTRPCFISPGKGFSSLGHNIEDHNTCTFSATKGDLVNQTNYTLILQDDTAIFWGNSRTKLFRPASPADPTKVLMIGKGVNCPGYDQRGVFYRRANAPAKCDIGSVELSAVYTRLIVVLPLILR